jgi:hypothetical protein
MTKKDELEFDFNDSEESPKLEQFLSNVLSARNLAIFNPCDLHGSLKILSFSIKADKDYAKGTTFALCRIPQSQVRILGALSRIKFNLSCNEAVIGWPKFKKRNQQMIEADFKGFGKVSELKGETSFLEHLPGQTITVDSLEGVYAVCLTLGDGKKGDSIEGYLIYVKQ